MKPDCYFLENDYCVFGRLNRIDKSEVNPDFDIAVIDVNGIVASKEVNPHIKNDLKIKLCLVSDLKKIINRVK